MHIDIRRLVDATELPQTGVGVVVAQGELAAGTDEAPDNHRQGAAHPGLGA